MSAEKDIVERLAVELVHVNKLCDSDLADAITEAAAEIVRLRGEVSDMEARKDHAYSERNALAIAFAKIARLAGLQAGHGFDNCPEKGWDPEWLHVVYVELPDGRQVSWHMGPDMVERAIAIGEYGKPWDGAMHGRDLSWCEFEAIAPAEAKGDFPEDALAALRGYRQADMEGVFVTVSREALDMAIERLGAPQPAGGEAVAWNVLRIGNYGAAYDSPNTHRAFTYDHQPGNVDASRLGGARNAAAKMSGGDNIDFGLGLLKALQDAGFGVFQIGPEATTPPAAQVQRKTVPCDCGCGRECCASCGSEMDDPHPAGDALGAVRELADQLRGELLHTSPLFEATMYERGRISEKQRCIDMLDAIAPPIEAALRPSAGEEKG